MNVLHKLIGCYTVLPYDHDSNVESNHIDPVYHLNTGKGLLSDNHTHKDKDERVGKVTKHPPKPVQKGLKKRLHVILEKDAND